MLRRCTSWLYSSSSGGSVMTTSEACRVFGFAAPPTSRRVLRRRFAQLAQTYHPDVAHSSSSSSSRVDMARITAAYRHLREELHSGRAHTIAAAAVTTGHTAHADKHDNSRSSSCCRRACVTETNVPHATRSRWSDDVTLPWQRTRRHTTTTRTTTSSSMTRMRVVRDGVTAARARLHTLMWRLRAAMRYVLSSS